MTHSDWNRGKWKSERKIQSKKFRQDYKSRAIAAGKPPLRSARY